MFVGRQCVSYSKVGHDNKRNCIAKGIEFVITFCN
jgi:hypothetical protein